jgi:hypothetical protein
MLPSRRDREQDQSQILHSLNLRIIAILRNDKSAFSLKRAFQAIEFFTKKGMLDPVEISRLAASQSTKSSGKSPGEPEDDSTTFRSFALELLQWITSSDIAPAAGEAIAAFFATALKYSTTEGDYSDQFSWSPILLESIHRNADHLEAYKNHVFPSLFEIGQHDFYHFLDQVHFVDLQGRSARSKLSTRETIILCSVLEVAKAVGILVEASCMS